MRKKLMIMGLVIGLIISVILNLHQLSISKNLYESDERDSNTIITLEEMLFKK